MICIFWWRQRYSSGSIILANGHTWAKTNCSLSSNVFETEVEITIFFSHDIIYRILSAKKWQTEDYLLYFTINPNNERNWYCNMSQFLTKLSIGFHSTLTNLKQIVLNPESSKEISYFKYILITDKILNPYYFVKTEIVLYWILAKQWLEISLIHFPQDAY